MARPQALQFLRKGALLVGKVFPNFVATWNWLIGAFDAMRGDADVDPKNGYISVDRTNPDQPIIRLNAQKVANLAGGGGGGDAEVEIFGTDGSSAKGKSIHITSARSDQVTATVSPGSDGVVYVSIGVQYE